MATALLTPQRLVELEIDGRAVRVFEGSTILDACTALGIETPTLCYGETLRPANVCRVCVVELEGARVLAPACSRKVEPGMAILTDSERVRTSRKVVLEFLGSSVDVSLAGPAMPDGSIHAYMDRYGADPSRFGPPALPAEAASFDPRLATRHNVRPGVTGLWQVEGRDNPSFGAYRRLDVFYVENWSLLLDITILCATVPAVIGRGWRSLRREHTPSPELAST